MVLNDLNFIEALRHLSKNDKILEKIIKGIKPKEPLPFPVENHPIFNISF